MQSYNIGYWCIFIPHSASDNARSYGLCTSADLPASFGIQGKHYQLLLASAGAVYALVGERKSYHHYYQHYCYSTFNTSWPLVGCTTYGTGSMACTQYTLSLAPTVSITFEESQTGEWFHTVGKLQTLQCVRSCQEEELNRGVECNKQLASCCSLRARASMSDDLRKCS